ncbi:MAG: hypothetical protein PHO37_07770 [Kiritimatiellae bacterium]|nr:hypothetical protein [Kiritimatiellia bacterium]
MNHRPHIYAERDAQLPLLLALAALLLAAALQSALRLSSRELPQRSADSILTMISDDTRRVVSGTMMTKVDEYFHGGVKAQSCTVCAADEAHSEGAEDDHHHDHDHATPQHVTGFNPVAWINARIHAQEHRHLSDQRSVELLPWVVAASRASPHNIQAYEVGSYILNRMSDKPQIAVGFIKEGIKNNPESPELEVTLGEMCYNTLKDQPQAAAAFERALAKSLARTKNLTEDDLFLRLKIYFYLGRMAKDNHEIAKLREITEQALELKHENVMAQSLAKWLKEEENLNKE